MKRVISLWLPTFTTDRFNKSTDYIDNINSPKNPLHSFPMIVVTKQREGLWVEAANNYAKQLNIKPGISLAEAQTISPNLVIRKADFRANFRALKKLTKIFERYSPWVCIDPQGGGMIKNMRGSNGIWIDITGCAHLYNGENLLIKNLRNLCSQEGYESRVGLADTPGAAWAVARFSNEPYKVIPPEQQKRILASYPIAALRINVKTIKELDRLGLRQIQDLYQIPRGPLTARFKDNILIRLDQMLGRIQEPISPQKFEQMSYTRIDFAEPITLIKDISVALEELLKKLFLILEEKNLGVLNLKLTVFRVDNTQNEIEIGTRQVSRDLDHLAFLFRDNLHKLDPGFGIELITLIATKTSNLTAQQKNFIESKKQKKSEAYSNLIDKLSGRLGINNIIRIHSIESHLPEHANSTLPMIQTATSVFNRRHTSDTLYPYQYSKRPIELLSRPLPIQVIESKTDGFPMSFLWSKQQYQIVRLEGPERISPEWWKSKHFQAGLKTLSQETRDYYRLEDKNGKRYWVYRKGFYDKKNSSNWFLHGFFA